MALSGSVALPDGSTSTHFVIQRIELSPIVQSMEVTVNGYFTQAAFNAGCSPNYSVVQYFPYGVGVTDVTLAQVYALLQTLPQFTGASVV